MATYSEEQRKKYATVEVNGHPAFPVGDKNHAKLALAMINKGGLSHEQKMTVIAKAHKVLASK